MVNLGIMQVHLNDQKALRRFDMEQNIAANRKRQQQSTQKSKKRHINERRLWAEQKKEEQAKLQKARQTSEPVVFVLDLFHRLRINTPRFEFVHKKFKGEYGIFMKDNRNLPKHKRKHEHDSRILFRFPNECRYKNIRTKMHITAEGCWSSMRKTKTMFLLLRVDIEKDEEYNATDAVKADEVDFYPDSSSSDKEEDEAEKNPVKRQLVQKWYLLKRTLNEDKCSCHNVTLKNLRDEREVGQLLERCERALRRAREGKRNGQAYWINAAILDRENSWFE